jgi:hypothetical protein
MTPCSKRLLFAAKPLLSRLWLTKTRARGAMR